MRIAGTWLLCDDGVPRPIVIAKALAADGSEHADRFLVDTGADRTVFSAALRVKLGLPGTNGAPGLSLQGIGGISAFVLVDCVLEFTRDDGKAARVRGQFAAFADPAASDLSILGRDVLSNFDLIVSRPRNDLLFLSGNHHYLINQS